MQVPLYYPVLSRHLSRVLDDIGLNERTVKWRQDTYLKNEQICSLTSSIAGRKTKSYNLGSQIEGSTTLGLVSDIDTLRCYKDANVIQRLDDWTKGKVNFLMIREDGIPSSYCRLQIMQEDVPAPAELEGKCSCTYARDDMGRVLLKSSCMQRGRGDGLKVHGPAVTATDIPGRIDADCVYSYKCDSWPEQARPWLERVRNKHWPTPDIVNFAEETGCFIVPVGYRLSQTRELEWRISPSLTERRFLLSMNIVQMRCYVLLKMIKKTLIAPRVGDCVSSFQLKTAMFYSMENSPRELWREDNLLKCVTQCLFLLLTWLHSGFCPNYLFGDENLFAGRITSLEQSNEFISVVEGIIRSEGRFLFQISCDELSSKLKDQMTKLEASPVGITAETQIVISSCQFSQTQHFLIEIMSILVKFLDYETTTCIKEFGQLVNHLSICSRQATGYTREAAELCLPFLCSIIGTILASLCIGKKLPLHRQSLAWLQQGTQFDFLSGRLKLASVLYCSGDSIGAAVVLQDIENNYDRRLIQRVCGCKVGPGSEFLKGRFVKAVPECQSEAAGRQLMACCVVFSRQEVHCCPPALRFEMYRSAGKDEDQSAKKNKWMRLASMDACTYYHYLRYITNRELGNRQASDQALQDLAESISVEQQVLAHHETAMNVLGQCLEMEEMLEEALECYKLSLKLRPQNNAAKLHLQNLRYKVIQQVLWC